MMVVHNRCRPLPVYAAKRPGRRRKGCPPDLWVSQDTATEGEAAPPIIPAVGPQGRMFRQSWL